MYVKVVRDYLVIDYVKTVPEVYHCDGTVVALVLWYNRQERSWVGMMRTKEGYQAGASEYCFGRECAQKCIEGRYDALVARQASPLSPA